MDTREKILTLEMAAQAARRARDQGVRVTLVSGHFDPLLAEHARRLSELAPPGGLLVVAITEPPEPFLPPRARAKLVAALRAVGCVVVADAARPEEVARQIPAEAVFHEEPEDLRRTREFVARARARLGA